MKKIVATAALLAMASVQAEELKFGDLNYFIPAGQFNLSAGADFRSQERDDNRTDTARNTPNTNEVEGYYVQSLLTYGLSDKLNLMGGLDYNYEVEGRNEDNTSQGNYTQDGLANPKLGAIFRLTNQNDNSYNIDIGALARVNIQDADTGIAGEDGNAADGRSSLDLYARMGRKWNEANEWQLTGGLTYHAAGEHSEARIGAADEDYDDESSVDMFVRAAYQYRPIHEFMMALALQTTRVGEVESDGDVEGETTYESHLNHSFSFMAKYLITKNVIGRFNYTLHRLSDIDTENDGGDSEIENRKGQGFGLGVDFLF